MDADGVDVLHVADDDAVVGGVAQDFVFDFFPAEEAGFDQGLVDEACGQAGFKGFSKLRFTADDAAAGAAEGVRRSYHERVACYGCEVYARLDVGHDRALGDGLADREHRFLEARAVLGEDDRLDRGAEDFDAVLFEDAGVFEFDREVEAGLTAERREQRVGPFAFDNRFERGACQRFQVDGVGDLGVGHDRRGVRVDEDDAVAFFSEGTARLDAGIVKLGGLPDDDGARADDEDAAATHRRCSFGGKRGRALSAGALGVIWWAWPVSRSCGSADFALQFT